jgi:hypothetical protein
MSKDLPENNTQAATTDNLASTSQTGDLLNSFISAPQSKLDADQYMVSDLDGVTEGLFGSGNMNFLMMQSAQTNEAMSHLNPLSALSAGDGFSTASLIGTSNANPESFVYTVNDSAHNAISAMPLTRAAQDSGDAVGFSSPAGAASFQSSAQPTSQGITTSDTVSVTSVNGSNGSNGSNGNNGGNGSDGTNGNGTGDIIINNTIINTINNNTTIVDIDDAVTNIFDTVNNITENVFNLTETVLNIINLDSTVTNLFDTVNNLTNNIFTTINEILGGDGNGLGPIGLNLNLDLSNLTHLNLDFINGDNILNVINEVIDLSPILDPVTDLVGNIASGLDLGLLVNPFTYDDSPDDKDLVVTSALELLGIPLPPLGIDLPLDPVEFLLGDIDLSLNLDNDLLNGILEGSAIGDLLGGDLLGGDLLGGDLLGGLLENDITDGLLGEGGVEGLLGGLLGNGGEFDQDLSAGVNANLLGTNLVDLPLDLVLNPVEDLLGDVDVGAGLGLDLLGSSETSNAAGDTDIVIPLDINLGGSNLISDTLFVNLDPVEAIVGDIDLDLTAAADVLGDVADPLIDNFAGGAGTDSLLSEIGDLAGDIVGGLLPSTGDSDLSSDIVLDLVDSLPVVNNLDLNLDAVENVLGDIDIVSDIAGNLFGSITGGDSQDLSIVPDISALGTTALDQPLTAALDPVESLLGNLNIANDVLIDLVPSMPDASALQDILGPINSVLESATGAIDSLPVVGDLGDGLSGLGGLGDILSNAGNDNPLSWTESVLPDTGDLLGGGLLNDIGGLLSDPVGATSLLSTPVLPILSAPLGGGGNHFGGLFG